MLFAHFAKPAGARMRRPDAMSRGVEYSLLAIAKEKSKYPDRRTGEAVFKSVAVYKDFDMTFYTYLPYQYDNKADSFYLGHNRDIKGGKKLRVFYLPKNREFY